MTAVGELMLILGLLVSAHCEVRARDPEVEVEEDHRPETGGGGGGGGRGGWELGSAGANPGGFGMGLPPHLRNLPHGHRPDGQEGGHVPPLGHGHHHQGHQGQHPLGLPEEVAPPSGEGGNYPARTGNWCAFVHRRMVTMAVSCGTEKYTIKSQSPCPSGTPECQLVMYKLSTRPVYRQKEKVFTALLWRCCPGHGGENCEETAVDGQVSDSGDSAVIGRPHPGSSELHSPDVEAGLQRQPGDPEQVQNDYQVSGSPLYDASLPDNTSHNDTQTDSGTQVPLYPDPDLAHTPQHGHPHDSKQQAHQPIPDPHHRDHQHNYNFQSPVVDEVDEMDADPLPYPDAPSALPLPHMMALVMSQLQPFLQGFNRTLEHLSQQVGGLARDVAQLQRNQWGVGVQGEAFGGPGHAEAVEERFDDKLDETFQHIDEVRRLLESHRAEMEDRLHSQHVMLHYNLTSIKTDIDMKLKRNHKMLQVNLQAMNATLADMKLEQEQLAEECQRSVGEDHRAPSTSQSLLPPPQPLQPQQAMFWVAIERLNNKVINNTVKVNGLVEDLETTMGNIQDLTMGFKDLEEGIAQTGRTNQIHFMETGLEVEAAKVTVLNRVNELAGNLSMQAQRLSEMDVDVDYLYTTLYKSSNVSEDCDCKALKADISRLEQGVANVTELANDNRLALDGTGEAERDQWGQDGDWEPAVEDLQQGLQQVKESLAFEQERTRTLHHNVTQLTSSVAGSREEVSGLRESDQRLVADMRRLASSFNSLLKDAIRHADVLEMLLGEEVLEFMDWPIQDQEAHSIPTLKEKIQHMQEQISRHNLSITSLLGDRQGDMEEAPAADQPSSHLPDWLNGLKKKNGHQRREHQLIHPGERHTDYSDGGDLWSLEKAVEELGAKVRRLEERPCPASCNSSGHKEVPSGGVEAKLQAEVTWLKRGLEDHLRVFKNIFSNTETLAGSDATLDVDKLWTLVKRREGKSERKAGPVKKRGGKEGPSGRGNLRSRRDTSGNVPASPQQRDNRLLFLASSLNVIRENGQMLFEARLNHGKGYSKTGTFRAPVKGTYLFVLTLDLKPGPARVVLRRESGAFASLHREEATEGGPVTRVCLLPLQKGEEIHLELKEGAMVNSKDNVFAGFLLHQYT